MRSAVVLALLVACGRAEPEPEPVLALDDWCPAEAGAEAVEAEVEAVLAAMSLHEKVSQLSGTSLLPNGDGLWPTPADEVHGIPGFRMVDGPRGAHRATGDATAFPVGMARGATWDPALEARVGRAIGAEVKGKGANVLLAPTVNVLRHPRWGRAQETYGEDPHHIGAMGVGFVRGAQEHVIADAKHYALNSIEDTRFDVSVQADEATLHEVYLPHFLDLVREGGVGSVMSAYNHVDGLPASENPQLLRDILKGEWGFHGFVVSDWVWAAETTAGSAMGGLDVEMPFAEVYGEALVEAVEAGEVPEAVVDEAVHRVLRTKLCFDVQPAEPDPSLVLTEAHVDLAREVATRSMVLLRNEGAALPVEAGAAVLVTGRLADVENIGDSGSSSVDPPHIVTLLQGLVEGADGRAVVHSAEPSSAELDAADVVIAVVGYTEEDEGEGLIAAGDRSSMDLRAEDVAHIEALSAAHDRVVVVLMGGSAITMPWVDEVEAVVMAWYPGMEGGHALADLAYGRVDFTGRLPISFPREEGQLPPFDNTSLEVRYERWHGYTHLDREDSEPLYPFGFGLAYAPVALSELAVDGVVGEDAVLTASVVATNEGERATTATVQVYVGREGAETVRELRGFAQVALEPGASETVRVDIDVDDLRVRREGQWVLEEGRWLVWAGSSSRELLGPVEGAR